MGRCLSSLMGDCEWHIITLPRCHLSVLTWWSSRRIMSNRSFLMSLVTSKLMFRSLSRQATMNLLKMPWLIRRWDAIEFDMHYYIIWKLEAPLQLFFCSVKNCIAKITIAVYIYTPCPYKNGATDFFTITFTNMHGFLWFLVHNFANEY